VTKEYSPTRTTRAILTQVHCNGLTDIGWQGQLRPTAAFSADGDMSVVSVDIFQVERYDFTGT